jgi:hypothetical protein
VIRLLLRAYPAAWRRRYGDEIVELTAETGLSWSAGVDLVRGGISERVRGSQSLLIGGNGMVIGPAWRHPTGSALAATVVMAPTLLFVIGSVLAYQLGLNAMQAQMDGINAWLSSSRVLDLMLVMAPAVALALAVAPLVRFQVREGDAGREAVLGFRLKLGNAVVAAVAVGLGALLAWHIVVESVMRAGS